jgi:hypothetical protein
MDVQVNWLAIVLATLSTMVIGSVWYTPKVFGKRWMELTKVKPTGKMSDAYPAIAVTVVVSFVTAYVLAHIAYMAHAFFQHSFVEDSLTTAFWLWLGFTAARFVTHDAFEMRPWQLTVINVVHELVTILVMGLIIGLLAPTLVVVS